MQQQLQYVTSLSDNFYTCDFCLNFAYGTAFHYLKLLDIGVYSMPSISVLFQDILFFETLNKLDHIFWI